MQATLKRHPDYRCDPVERIEAEAVREGPDVLLRYVVTGDIAGLKLAPLSAPTRADELWKHTCFELFVHGAGNEYVEFNFAPSTQWQAYGFRAHRSGRWNLLVAAPTIEQEARADCYEMRVRLPWAQGGPMAISTIIEEQSGRLSYWAVRHPPDKPDFHHAHGYVLELAGAD